MPSTEHPHDAAPSFDSPQVCGLCLRGWGSKIVTPPPGYFHLLNTRTGKYHAEGRGSRTRCGRRVTIHEFKDVTA